MNIGFWTYYNIIHNKNYLSNIKEHNVKKKSMYYLMTKLMNVFFLTKSLKYQTL